MSSPERPHFLIVCTKWMQADPALGPSSLEQILFSPIKAWGNGTYEVFFVDEYFSNTGMAIDDGLINACAQNRPDVVLLVWWPGGPQPLNPSLDALYTIRHKLNSRIVALWFDTWADWLVDEAGKLADFVDFGVVTDNIDHFRGQPHEKRLVAAVEPMDTLHFYDPGLERDIDVSFNGGVNNYPDRIEALSQLRAAGIDVVKFGGQLESPLPLDQYAGIFMRSKISLSFSYSGGKLTSKGRTWEATLCGSMLIETSNPYTSRRLRPYIDFVPFDDYADLVDKVRYYLDHEDERRRIAESGKTAVLELARGEDNFFSTLVRQAGQFPPPARGAAQQKLVNAAIVRSDPCVAREYMRELDDLEEPPDGTSDLRQRVEALSQDGRWRDLLTAVPTFSIREPVLVGSRLPAPPTIPCKGWFNREAGTIILTIRNNNDEIPDASWRLIAFSDGSYDNYICVLFSTSHKTPAVHINADGEGQPFLTAHHFSLRRHTTAAIAVSYDNESCALAVGGLSLATCVLSALPEGIRMMDIGRHASEPTRLGFELLEFAYYPARMPDSLLLDVTAKSSLNGGGTIEERVAEACRRLAGP